MERFGCSRWMPFDDGVVELVVGDCAALFDCVLCCFCSGGGGGTAGGLARGGGGCGGGPRFVRCTLADSIDGGCGCGVGDDVDSCVVKALLPPLLCCCLLRFSVSVLASSELKSMAGTGGGGVGWAAAPFEWLCSGGGERFVATPVCVCETRYAIDAIVTK